VDGGNLANINPRAWAVIDGKLYLNFDKQIHRLWEKDREDNIARADSHWEGTSDK